MDVAVDFRVIELLCGRLCHDLVSPVGAINNGVELLDEDDPEFVKEAMGLIAQSARTAGRRLQFYRFAYGTSGSSAGASGRDVTLGLLEGGKVRCTWPDSVMALPPEWQRLACNLVALAAESLPRGGVVTVRSHANPGLEVMAEGEAITLGAETQAALAEGAGVDSLTTRTVHAYYTARLAQHLGARLAWAQSDGLHAVFTAAP